MRRDECGVLNAGVMNPMRLLTSRCRLSMRGYSSGVMNAGVMYFTSRCRLSIRGSGKACGARALSTPARVCAQMRGVNERADEGASRVGSSEASNAEEEGSNEEERTSSRHVLRSVRASWAAASSRGQPVTTPVSSTVPGSISQKTPSRELELSAREADTCSAIASSSSTWSGWRRAGGLGGSTLERDRRTRSRPEPPHAISSSAGPTAIAARSSKKQWKGLWLMKCSCF